MADTCANNEERIVMTPTKKTPRSTTIKMERVRPKEVEDAKMFHVAGGAHKGIVISKETTNNEDGQPHESHQLQLEFKVFLVNSQNSTHTQEKRHLRFWYKPDVSEAEQMTTAQDFFKELVSPMEFPRDYVGFIKKIMKLMQTRYPQMKRVEVELTQLEPISEPPTRPTTPGGVLYTIGRPWADHVFYNYDTVSMDDSIIIGKADVSKERVLEMIESAYPNPLTISDMAKQVSSTDEEVGVHIVELESKGLIKTVEGHHNRSYVRVTSQHDVKVVKQMPTVISSQQPTIAIITAQFCEKLAVDAMIENKDTYVRYTTVGESNVYTLGNIGAHRVVATKLPSVGHTRAAMIAAGNTTTRLLGSFQRVEYVFLVGCGGGVPHFTDYSKHVRLGDVVVATPPEGRSYIYAYCNNVKQLENGGFMFEAKTWTPPNLCLQQIARQLCDVAENNPEQCPWNEYIQLGLRELEDQEADFRRPPSDTDKLYMSLGGKDIIEVAHPIPSETMGYLNGRHKNNNMAPRVHFGAIGSGRHVVRDDTVRQEFAKLYGVASFDTEFDAVVESIFGNRKDSYIFIRGISDYRDGMRKKEWQPYAALAAAAFMKSVICALEFPPENE